MSFSDAPPTLRKSAEPFRRGRSRHGRPCRATNTSTRARAPRRRPRRSPRRRRPRRLRMYQTGTEGTVTKGAANFARICANLANAMDLHSLLLPTHLVNFAQIRQILRKFGQFCFFPHFLDFTPVYYTPVCSVPSRRHPENPAPHAEKRVPSGRQGVITLSFV